MLRLKSAKNNLQVKTTLISFNKLWVLTGDIKKTADIGNIGTQPQTPALNLCVFPRLDQVLHTVTPKYY
ncbi:tRNA pseudouridine synthase A, mitochondrial X1 [Biomphalaria glabrata]|nr:tRNA pseudouridine synthase A, mitochondrial X1 [Biomphalaria glabrata]